jgi:Cu/Ag efflux protein CusF
MKQRIAQVLLLASMAAPAWAQSIDGEVRKVDKAQQKISLAHGEIKALELPAMTMAYRVADRAMLEQVQVGDKVRFSADKLNGQLTITALRKP